MFQNVTEQDYRTAVLDPNTRQPFVESIDLGEDFKYVSAIEYSGTQRYVGSGGRHIFCIYPPKRTKLHIKGAKSTILAMPATFDNLNVHLGLEDFLSSLSHEIDHAKLIYENPSRAAPWGNINRRRKILTEIELEILEKQLVEIEKNSGISPEYKEMIKKRYQEIVSTI